MSDEFAIKDSGERASFAGGMVRDTSAGKTDFLGIRFGPMFKRWAVHTTKGREKYPDPEPGVPNWTLAQGEEELNRFRVSAARHFEQWLAGDRDEDHAAAVFFNINGAEYVRDKLNEETDEMIRAALRRAQDFPNVQPLKVGDRVRVVRGKDQFNSYVGKEGVLARLGASSNDWAFYVNIPGDYPKGVGFAADELERA